MTKTLEMKFRDVMGKEIMLSLPNPKDDLTLSAVTAVMQDIITRNLFTSRSGDLVDIVDAKIRVVDVTVLS